MTPSSRLALIALFPLSLAAAESGPAGDALVFDPAPKVANGADAPGEGSDQGQIWFGKRILVDTWGVVSAPAGWDGRDWLIAGGAVAATVATGLWLDQPAQGDSQEDRSAGKDRWSGAWGELGTIYSFVALGVAGTYGWIADDERGVNAMIDGLEASVIASGIICPALKFIVGRSRPQQAAQDSDQFQPFSGNNSFPSGHATQAFTVATVVACTFDDQPLLGGAAFALATGVGLSRINDNAHYASDVVAGAILGTWVGYEIVHFNRRRRGEEVARARGIADAQLDLILDHDRQGVSFTWHW